MGRGVTSSSSSGSISKGGSPAQQQRRADNASREVSRSGGGQPGRHLRAGITKCCTVHSRCCRRPSAASTAAASSPSPPLPLPLPSPPSAAASAMLGCTEYSSASACGRIQRQGGGATGGKERYGWGAQACA